MLYKTDNQKYFIQPKPFNIYSEKNILKYAVSALLYIPATHSNIGEMILKSCKKQLNSICICLEDSVDEDCLEVAEKNVVEYIEKLHKQEKTEDFPLIFIRIRNANQLKRLISTIKIEYFNVLTGFVIPKIDTTNILEYEEVLIPFFKQYKKVNGKEFFLMPILESKRIIEHKTRFDELYSLKSHFEKLPILNIRIGVSDFCNLYKVRRTKTATIYDILLISNCLSDIINVFGSEFICSGGVFEYYKPSCSEDLNWADTFIKEIELDKLNGFFGKTCIHPSQIPYILKSCIVKYDEYMEAMLILRMKNEKLGVQGSFRKEKMNEYEAHKSWATQIIEKAEVYGVLSED